MLTQILARYLVQLQQNPAATSSLIVVLVLLVIVLGILSIIGWWKVFEKAGRPGWHAVIPYLDEFERYGIAWPTQTWLFWAYLLAYVGEVALSNPTGGTWPVSAIVAFVIWELIRLPLCFAISKSFGKGNGFGIGLWLADFVFAPLLGFGGDAYKGPAAQIGLAYDEFAEPDQAELVEFAAPGAEASAEGILIDIAEGTPVEPGAQEAFGDADQREAFEFARAAVEAESGVEAAPTAEFEPVEPDAESAAEAIEATEEASADETIIADASIFELDESGDALDTE